MVYTVDMVFTVDMVYTVDMVFTVDMVYIVDMKQTPVFRLKKRPMADDPPPLKGKCLKFLHLPYFRLILSTSVPFPSLAF